MNLQKEVIKKQIGDYCFNMDDIIGEGYSSKVYKGYHMPSNNLVAVKVISSQSYTSPIQQSLLSNEIKILLQIDHPNLLKVHEISQSVNNTYIVSEYCDGGNLEKIMEGEPLKTEKIMEILAQVSKGLLGLHQKSITQIYLDIIHRDIKPANILIKDGIYKVADFGFALIENQYDSIIKKFNVGTPMYMAPEIKLFNQYSEKTDVWAIGIMLYEMLFLRIPDFQQSYKSLIDDTKKKCKTLEKQYQNQITELFEGILQLEPDDRISIEQVLRILQMDHVKNSPLVKLSQKSISTQLNSPLQFKVPKTPNEIRNQYLEQIKSNKKPSSFDQISFATMLRVKTCVKDEVSQFTMTTEDIKSPDEHPKSHREMKNHKREDSDTKIEFLGQLSTDCSLQEIQLPAILKPTYNFCQFLEKIIQTNPVDELHLKYNFLLRKLLAIKAKVFYTFAPDSIKDQLNYWKNQLQEYFNTVKHQINLNIDKTFQLFFNPSLNDQGKLLMMYIISLANQIREQNIHIQTIVSILSDNLQHQNDPFLFARKWAQSQ